MANDTQLALWVPSELQQSQDALNRIKTHESAGQLVGLVKQIIRPYGLGSFVFVSMRRDDETRESYRYLIGCDPVWCQHYRARNWYTNDPFVAHAVSDSTMVLGSAITTGSASQREMLATAAHYGFRSGMVVPAHGGANARIGVLYLGSALPPEQIESRLWANRFVMRQLAFELYEWWQAKLHAQSVLNQHLDAIDLKLLRDKRDGYTTTQICARYGYSKAMIDTRLRRICEKLAVTNMKQAVSQAMHLDILIG
jgi:DNA-binding CsgD family transcriptional regulator